MQFKNYVTCVHGCDSVVQDGRIELENRNIRHAYYINGNGEITITVNGNRLSDLVTKPLFKNTFSTFSD